MQRERKRRMQGRLVLAALWLAGFGGLAPSSARATEKTCGPHEHLVVEKDEDEGSTIKRCVCDVGWDADGPGAPCRQAKPEKPAKKPKKS